MTDSPLTERGRQQARKLGEAVKASGVHIDEILYSPLSRAADTAMAIAEATGLPARCEPRLREAVLWQIRGHAPQRRRVPRFQRPTSPTATTAARA